RLLFLHLAVLFEELIEQHRVHLVVTHAVGFSLFVAYHQIRIDRLHLLGHQPKLWNPLRVYSLLVSEGDRFESKERFTGVVHWLDLILNRADEVIVPSLPFELMRTATPFEDVAPKILPIKQLFSTLLPAAPIQMTLLAVVT